MRRALRVFARGLGLFCLAGLLGFGLLAWQVDRLGRHDDARPADVIVVLGARVEANGRPGSDLTSRTFHAVDLWQAGLAPQLICTGGFKDEPLSAAAVCRRFAIELGMPAGDVWLADGTRNTIEDAQTTAQVMVAHGWRTAILVSHPLHLYRARWLFRRAGVDAVTSPTSTETKRIFPLLR
ncbi:MAG: YdcF family protein, partial [Chloroflexi bacterium HGW-Chloroflexi-1]